MPSRPPHYELAGELALCRGDWSRAITLLREVEPLHVKAGRTFYVVETRLRLALAYLAAGDATEARRYFEGCLQLLATKEEIDVNPRRRFLSLILGGLERTYDDAGAFRAYCRAFRETHAEWSASIDQWFLEPAEPRPVSVEPESAQDHHLPWMDWSWIDPLGDCDYTQAAALEIQASNGRGLGGINWSAPRLMRDLPEAAAGVVAQVTCEPALADRPSDRGAVALAQSTRLPVA